MARLLELASTRFLREIETIVNKTHNRNFTKLGKESRSPERIIFP